MYSLVRALGIDPGTKSFDLVVIEGERVVWEYSIPTEVVARDPMELVEVIEGVDRVDIIAGPSGYGTPIVCNDEIVDPELFAREILLLSSEEDLRIGIERGEVGISVYKGLADIVKTLWSMKLSVCYIPSVILLPTIPIHRKLNKIDMGTADKLAVTVLGVYDQSREYGLRYDETSFILVEMGFGYNAVIGVDRGRVVDGYGGTMVSTGFLTIGPIDAEVVVAGKNWYRYDVFYGGVSTACNTVYVEEALEKAKTDSLCREAFRSMYESIWKTIKAVQSSIEKPREILLSGRLTSYEEIYDTIVKYIEQILPTRRISGLPGAMRSKEAAQGYAIIGEGIGGGVFKDLVEHMEITKARGTVMDWVIHPRLKNARERLMKAYRESLKREVLKRIFNE